MAFTFGIFESQGIGSRSGLCRAAIPNKRENSILRNLDAFVDRGHHRLFAYRLTCGNRGTRGLTRSDDPSFPCSSIVIRRQYRACRSPTAPGEAYPYI